MVSPDVKTPTLPIFTLRGAPEKSVGYERI
jgi:hypothetical protein